MRKQQTQNSHTTKKKQQRQTLPFSMFIHFIFIEVMKSGEKKPNEYVVDDKMANPVGLTEQVLPSGAKVNIFKPKSYEGKTRQFGQITHGKRRRPNVDLDTIDTTIHTIATNVAKTKPVVVAESSIKDINNQFIFNANNFTADDYKTNNTTNFIMRIAPPTWTKPQVMNREKKAKSVNQKNRWTNLVQQRTIEIQQQKNAHKLFMASLAQHDEAIGASSSDAPIDLTTNLGLKFRIIDAVIKETGIEVPSSALATIKNTNDLVNFVTTKKQQLDQHRNRAKMTLPENVQFIYTDAIDRKKQPKWVKYKELREKNSIAGATADV